MSEAYTEPAPTPSAEQAAGGGSKPVSLLIQRALRNPVIPLNIPDAERRIIARLHPDLPRRTANYLTTMLVRLGDDTTSTTQGHQELSDAIQQKWKRAANIKLGQQAKENAANEAIALSEQDAPYRDTLDVVRGVQSDYLKRFIDNDTKASPRGAYDRATFETEVYDPTKTIQHPALDYLVISRTVFKPEVFIHADRLMRMILLDNHLVPPPA